MTTPILLYDMLDLVFAKRLQDGSSRREPLLRSKMLPTLVASSLIIIEAVGVKVAFGAHDVTRSVLCLSSQQKARKKRVPGIDIDVYTSIIHFPALRSSFSLRIAVWLAV